MASFVVAVHSMAFIWTNKSMDGHCQPFFDYFSSKDQRWWGLPQFKVMSFNVIKN